MTTKIWDSFAEAEPLIRPFLKAHNRAAFHSFDWLSQCWQHFGRPGRDELVLVGVFSGERLVAFAPLCSRKRLGGVREISFIGEEQTPYPGIAGTVNEQVLEGVVQAISARYARVVYRFHHIIEENPLGALLEETVLFADTAKIVTYSCPYIQLDDEAETVPRNKKRARNLKSLIRRLQQIGELRCEVVDFDKDREAALEQLEEMLALHTLRHRRTLNAWCDPQHRQFLRDYLEQAESTGMLALTLTLDGELMSFHFGFRVGDALVLYIIAIHPAFAPFSAGHINQHLALERCRELGIKVYDLSNGASFAKNAWATGSRLSCRYVMAGDRSLATRLAMARSVYSCRLKTWTRERGLNYKVRRLLGPILERESEEPKRPGMEWPGVSPQGAAAEPLRYRAVADLPAEKLASVIRFVHEHGKKAPVQCQRLGDQVRLMGASPQQELVLPLGKAAC
ncbi:MAG: GNAT family N-acetyltransferase [bacterium]|nr:GNAT family N-acetyltransferase [bacterium]